ncbi:MAG: YibE/F family protein [Candidatus Paceibacterota bacterium]
MKLFKKISKSVILLFVIFISFSPIKIQAQDTENSPEIWKAKVEKVLEERTEQILDTVYPQQTLRSEILNGPQKGEIIEIENDFQKLKTGDRFYFRKNILGEEEVSYIVTDVVRQGPIILLLAIFVIIIVIFGRWQGVRSLVALAASFLAIMLILIPGILNGWNPLFAGFLVAGAILFAAIFFTHGFNRESAVAYSGTMIAVIISGLFAIFAVYITKLTGFSAEESVYLNMNTGGTINFIALLLGAFIIGFLGVLDDIAITQSAVVTELYNINPGIKRKEVYARAMRVGREHVGALVNTLVLAYTGASLPLLLYFNLSSTSLFMTINLEIFATEIVRIIVGSIGLILTVPIVTLLAVKYKRL